MSASLIADNLLRPFQLERSTLRGRVVRLGDLVDQVLTRHDYPEPVGRLLGELFVLAATLAGGLKFNGTFSLQIRSDGPVSLMLADCTNDGAMRGYARYDDAQVAAASSSDVEALLGHGHLAFTVDQNQAGQAYQGIVELNGPTLTDCMQTYFRQSEQLKTGLKIAVDRIEAGEGARWRAGGIMIQRLADEARSDWGPGRRGRGLAAHDAAARDRHRRPSWWIRTCRPSGCCGTCSTKRACACSPRSRCALAAAAVGSASRPCCAGFRSTSWTT